jgi:DNA polymerase-3 subunit epsilon/ATP-dependent DNA helicase DinG
MLELSEGIKWALRPLFLKIESKKASSEGKSSGGIPNIFVEKREELVADPEPEPLDVEWLSELMEEHGLLSKSIQGFEHREGQLSVMLAVARALNGNQNLMVEAGPGTGKSLAYLLPATMFAFRNATPVVISTNTINLQEQLVDKDIPALLRALELSSRVRVANLKGRSNYLCLRRWETLYKERGFSEDELKVVLRILVWLSSTSSGDIAELGLSWNEMPVWNRACSRGDSCLGERCPHRRLCFFRRARDRTRGAHLVVVNHALLLSDAIAEGKILPSYRHLIADEAHHLEEEATQQLGFEVGQDELDAHLGRLNFMLRSWSDSMAPAKKGGHPKGWRYKIDDSMGREVRDLRRQVKTLGNFATLFFKALSKVTQYHGGGDDYEHRLRLDGAAQRGFSWQSVISSWEKLKLSFMSIDLGLVRLHGMLEGLPECNHLAAELSSLRRANSELWHRVNSVIIQPEPKNICWLSRRKDNIRLCSAPLDVGEGLGELLFSGRDSIILTGATLSTEGNFRYIKDRLGIDKADELLVESPFDYRASTLICLPRDMPEPNESGYQEKMERSLVELCRMSGGRTLVLFTSHAALRDTYSKIQPLLEEDDILVVGQGIDGSPKKLVSTLESNPRTVLLGAGSLWEGVDVAGDALSVLVITRLPFAIPTDPVHQARHELFSDGFREYTLPQSILKFKQGFGRLIRRKEDRGAVVILDRRLETKYYGSAFLKSLPDCHLERGSLREMPSKVARWLRK